jgi:acyl-CoA dehydrogenase
MDFTLPEEVEKVRKKAREFALKEFTAEKKVYYDKNEKYPDEIRKKAYEAGFLDINNPWGMLVTMEEFCRVDPGLGLSSLVPAFGSEVLLFYGSDEQKKKFLEPVLKGEKISGFAITESGAGSDVAGISTKLEKKDGKWILNGEKMFITNGTVANHFYALTRTSPPPSFEKRHHGLTMIIVESTMPGFTASQLKGKMGMRATNTAELTFDNVVIPEENIIGEVGKGFYYVMTFFNISRIYVAAQGLGIAEGAYDRLMNYIIKNKNSGSKVSDNENTEMLVAEIATKIEAARLITYKAASYLFNFNPDPATTSMAKYYTAEAATFATEKVLEYMGLDGINTDLERLYRDSKITDIWEGTSEVEKLVIARMLIKNTLKEGLDVQ